MIVLTGVDDGLLYVENIGAVVGDVIGENVVAADDDGVGETVAAAVGDE